jgi:hypothetical protein
MMPRYRVGRNRPPKESRFPKGKSGNPKGRPKGSRNLANVLDKELKKSVMLTENGVRRKVDKATAIVKRQLHEALEGDQRSFNSLLKIMDQHSTNESASESPTSPFEIGLLRKYLPYLQEIAERENAEPQTSSD